MWNPKILSIWVPKLRLSFQGMTPWNIDFQMLIAFVLMTKNTSIRYFIIKTCCHYTLNGTNNTQMLHCEHEDDLSHMLYFI